LGVISIIRTDIRTNFEFLGKQAADDVVNQLEQGILGNNTFKEMSDTLVDSIVGSDIRGGSLTRYAKTYAHDAIMEFDRSVHILAGNNFKAEHFMYVGPLDNVTRPFCQQRVGKVFTKESIPAENDMGFDAWTTCGGYNCRHAWLPVSDKVLDEFVLAA